MEANEEKRAEYKETIKDIASEEVMYIDKGGIDMTICRDRGWGKKSEKLASKKSGKYYERTNIIAPMVFNG